jgi:type II secretory pathway pseudopilin PulG
MKKILGFTWIELIAVVTIVAILGAISIPKIAIYIDEAKKTATQSILAVARTEILTFYVNKKASDTMPYNPTYNELITPQTVFGEDIGKNPYNNSNAIRNSNNSWIAGNPPIFGDCDTSSVCGWNYDETNGKIWANTNTIGENLF